MSIKKILIIACMAICAFSVSAGSFKDFYSHTAVELGDGIGMPLKDGRYSSSSPAWAINADIFYSVPKSPWDFAIFAHADDAIRNFKKIEKAKFKRSTFGVSSTYNFHKGLKTNPYVGIGLGTCVNYTKPEGITSRTWHPVAKLYGGVEFRQWLRLSAYCHITKSEYSTAGLSLGIVFGRGHNQKSSEK